KKLKRMKNLKMIGLALSIPHILLLLPFMKYMPYALPILALSITPAILVYRYIKDWRYAAVVGAHGLDGGATFFAIDFFGKFTGIVYGEQHVLSRAVGELFGSYFTFYALKISIALAAVYLIHKEKMREEEKNYILLIIMIMGFAPGIRGILRILVGG
ncbi:MAG: DUF63 family protein, partial [Candidatus ainarchaeum sp.]|nr:DUF63 family protein [Candidatus ainarchaeum sp.]